MGRRNNLAGRMMRPWIWIVLGLALIPLVVGWVAARADAVEREPITKCDSSVLWQIWYPNIDPPEATAAVAWAYAEVAPVAGLDARQDGEAKIRWQWPDPLADYTAPIDQWAETAFSGKRFWLHAHERTNIETLPSLKTQAIVDVLHDLGVQTPSSTAAGLSPGDRQAITRICAQQRQAAAAPSPAPTSSPAPSPGPEGQGDTRPAAEHQDVPESAVSPAPAGMLFAGWVLVLVIGAGVIWYLGGPAIRARVTQFRRKRAGSGGH